MGDVHSLLAQGVGAIGKIYFRTDEEMQQEPARFATVVTETDPDTVVSLMLDYWGIEKPMMLLSITGSAQGLDMDVRLENLIMEDLASTANSTCAWVTTGGNDAGVMELVGRALRSRDARSHLLLAPPESARRGGSRRPSAWRV